MKELKEKIRLEGSVIGTEIVKVDSFLNHQIDVKFLEKIGLEFSRRFADTDVDRILTAESSGIAIACAAAPYFGYPPVVFAKKEASRTLSSDFYEAESKSFTKGNASLLRVSKKYIKRGEQVLILDDFLAGGRASSALANIVEQAGAAVAGIGIVIEKEYQGGAELLRSKGYRLESLAVISEICDGITLFK